MLESSELLFSEGESREAVKRFRLIDRAGRFGRGAACESSPKLRRRMHLQTSPWAPVLPLHTLDSDPRPKARRRCYK